MKEDRFDSQRGYCRRLGHDVDFAYCRVASEGIPCFKILDCWFERFDVQTFMKTCYSPQELESILTGSCHKIATLYELIERAKQVKP